jgi:fermentation-respiration switch protein FrsA (DUF1100 family)
MKPSKPKRPQPPLWWRILRAPILAYLVVCFLLLVFEDRLTYIPTRYPGGWWEIVDLKLEDANFTSGDGTKLHGWFLEDENPQAVILFCHGNAGNITHRYDFLRAAHNYVKPSIFVFDYRGFGKSEGTPSEPGVLADARAARKWLAERTGVAEKDIVMMGESIGAAVAVDLAANDGARGLVLEDAFTSLPDTAAYHYPWIPVRLMMRGRLNSLEKIPQYHGPLLMAHGDADTIIPHQFGQRLFAAANEPKQFLTQAGADHNSDRNPEFYRALQQFVEDLHATAPDSPGSAGN